MHHWMDDGVVMLVVIANVENFVVGLASVMIRYEYD
jgi:hypothetical protein